MNSDQSCLINTVSLRFQQMTKAETFIVIGNLRVMMIVVSADLNFEGERKHAFNSDESLIGVLNFFCPSLFLRKASDIFSKISPFSL